MAPWYLRWILSTHSRSPLKMQGSAPSIDLDFENGFFQKGCQLNNFFFGTFLPSWMWSRDTVEMQGFELAVISVPPSDFHNFFEVATGHRRNAGNRAGGHFLSSLFSLLSFLCSVIAPFLCARVAQQDPCIFSGDYEASRPPTPQKCSDSTRPRGQHTLLSIKLGFSGGLFL